MATKFGVLGELTLHLEGQPLTIQGKKAGALLAVLLLRRDLPLTADQLIDVLWGRTPPRTANASLHNHLARLRALLGPQRERLVHRHGGYRLELRAGELDAEVFTVRLAQARDAHADGRWEAVHAATTAALGLWRGRPLPEFPQLHDSAAVTHLAELHLNAVELHVEARIHLGRHHDIVGDLTQHTTDHPLRESFHRQLMTVLHREDRAAEAIAVYHDLRRRLADELGIDPSPAIQKCFQEILDSPRPGSPAATVTTQTPRTKAQQPVAAPEPAESPRPTSAAPFQTPRDIGDFTGRRDELATLLAALREQATALPTVALVSGMGGVGKTTLVLRAAHLCHEDFPDGQLYADLRGFGTGTPRAAHDLLARFLADLGVSPRLIPDDTDDRASLYRTTLAGRRVLLLLDNARHVEQVLPLLPGAGPSAVVVTSRHVLAGLPGTSRITLAPLDRADQETLLASICGTELVAADLSATERVLDACAGLPLALRIVGVRLAQHGGRSMAGTADRLARTGQRLNAFTVDHLDIRNVFMLSYRALPGSDGQGHRDAARAFRRLGLWPSHPFSVEAASALLNQPLEHTMDLLDLLVSAHLLQNPSPGVFRFHDLLGEFAAERARAEESPADAEAALLRLLNWYRDATEYAERASGIGRARLTVDTTSALPVLLPEFTDGQQALQWVSNELPAVTAAVQLAASSSRPELAWHTAAALFAWIQGNWWSKEWEEPVATALTAAERESDLSGQAEMHNLLGMAHGSAHRNDISLHHLRAALAFYEQTGATERQVAVLANISNACSQAGRLDEARTAIEGAIRLADESGLPSARFDHTLGTVLLKLGDTDGAAVVYRRALDFWRKEGRVFFIHICLVTLGDTLRALGEREESLALLEEGLRIARKENHEFSTADTLEALGRAHFHFGDRQQARLHWREALSIAERHHLQRVVIDCRKGLESLEGGR
ncbi:AfsR/SARP family transcriptional regulator [Streptomyces aureus]|uniref:AfsR/SARP family transcriptional regulator n=1 Tax=Streptomyces aureus TaxID=193461 RepID=UPI00055BC255|nr:BTAD domain-containing putative transcriptional regulator [Streptomyces aureus]